MPPFPHSPYDAQKFSLVCTVPGFGGVELPAFIANGLQPVAKILLQDSSDGYLSCCGPRAAADSRSLGGVAAPEWRSLLAAPLRRIGGRSGVLGCAVCAVGPWTLGDRLPKPAVRRRWCVTVLGGLTASRWGSEWAKAVTSPTCATAQPKCPAQCPVAGPLRHIRQDSVM